MSIEQVLTERNSKKGSRHAVHLCVDSIVEVLVGVAGLEVVMELWTTPERMKEYRTYGPTGVGGHLLMKLLNDIEALTAEVARLESVMAERDRFQKLAEFYESHIREQIGKTIIEREPDGSPCWGGKAATLHLIRVCDDYKASAEIVRRLVEYTSHKFICARSLRGSDCDCGLDELRAAALHAAGGG